ncbi:hypothetical protein TNIN_347921 [Trichonephila inaurata madagascariensis]|uniref:Uncharacterized protein n=1 Tax=Trichonephila inaurata madagascariensis TaxID=2747483 RepID=A0A8X6YSB1_9ARAC|nr:hypothetical protein TNIN_347921 [Trichonephila inaurata madagascariensis]
MKLILIIWNGSSDRQTITTFIIEKNEAARDSHDAAKEVKRVLQKTRRPSKTTETITRAESHEESQSQTGTGRFPPCRIFKPFQRFYLGQEQPAPNPALLRVPTERSNIPILVSGKEKSPSKSELVTERKRTLSKYVSGQKKSYDGPSMKRPRVTEKIFESGKSPSKRELSPVVRGRSKIPRLVSGQEQPASKPEHSKPIVKRKGNSMTVSGKNNRRSRSPMKRTISHTHDKQSKDAISNGNISEPACGLRRSSRFRVPL